MRISSTSSNLQDLQENEFEDASSWWRTRGMVSFPGDVLFPVDIPARVFCAAQMGWALLVNNYDLLSWIWSNLRCPWLSSVLLFHLLFVFILILRQPEAARSDQCLRYSSKGNANRITVIEGSLLEFPFKQSLCLTHFLYFSSLFSAMFTIWIQTWRFLKHLKGSKKASKYLPSS